MNQEITLEKIMNKLEEIERLLSTQHSALIQPGSLPSSFLPGGKDWFLSSTEEERRAFNRKRGHAARRVKK